MLENIVATQNERLEALAAKGVVIVDPRQTFVAPDVDLERISSHVVLHPGTRLGGARTFLDAHAEVGREGPATLLDTVLGQRARIDSGFAKAAVLLADASAGANAHLRDGTVLEEQACTAHAVGLKQTILLPFVTLGSLINFCDCLMAGGTSRSDHSEVGSGYVHFNFTPWGKRGDKATPSLFGDVPRGVFLRQPRIFLGGMGGVVGPRLVGFGSMAAAGQVLRRDIGEGRLVGTATRNVDQEFSAGAAGPLRHKITYNVRYLANLSALATWYRKVRLARLPAAGHGETIVTAAALENIDAAIGERRKRLLALLAEHGLAALELDELPAEPCPLAPRADGTDHVTWVRSLDDTAVAAGVAWLTGHVDAFVQRTLG